MPGWTRPPLPGRWTGAAHPAFVGRSSLLSVIEKAWFAAAAGARQAVFVGGEPGAGKSRLVAEAATVLYGQHATVLLGTCVAELGPPYQPFVDPIEIIRASAEVGDLGVLDRLAVLIGRAPATGRAGVEHDPRALYQAVVDGIADVAEHGPVVLVLEDLHWAGPASLQLLTFVVERTADLPVLMLATARSTPPDRSSTFATVVAELAHQDGVRSIDVPPLTLEDVAEYLRQEARLQPEEALAAAQILHQQTRGNPFFLREVWRDLLLRGRITALGDAPIHAPRSVRDTVARRLGLLPSGSRRVVELAAVIGDDVEIAVLAAVAQGDAETTLVGLDDAVASGLLETAPEADGQVRFHHALARQAVLDSLPASRLIRDHARVAEVLDRRFPAAARRAQRLAHHYATAHGLGLEGRAVRYLREAAADADRSLAHADAAGFLVRAASLCGDPTMRDDLRLAAARSALLGANFPLACELDETVIETGTPEQRMRAAIGYEAASWRSGQLGHHAAALLTRALEATALPPTNPMVVQAMASLGRALQLSGAIEAGRAVGSRANDLARQTGDDMLLAAALATSLQGSLQRPRDHPLKQARIAELTAVSRRVGSQNRMGAALFHDGLLAYAHGDRDRWASAHDGLVHVAMSTGQPFWQYFASCMRHIRDYLDGDFGAAKAAARAALDRGRSFGTADIGGSHSLQVFMIRRITGRLESVRPLISGSEATETHWAPGLLALYTELGLRAGAARVLAELLDDDLDHLAYSGDWPARLAFMVEAAWSLGDRAAARRLRPHLLEHAGHNLVSGAFTAAFGSADRYLGMVDSLLGLDSCELWFDSALALDTAMAAPVHQAETLAARVGHARRIGAPPGQVEQLVGRARAIADPIGMRRIDLLLGDQPAAGPGAPPDGSSRLTAREEEVLELIAEGLSNRGIADRLVISEHTAANHVRSILAKTGSENRTQAARLVSRR